LEILYRPSGRRQLRPRIAPGTDQVGTVHAISAETGVTSSTVEPAFDSQGSE